MKTILLPFQDDDVAELALETALMVASQFNSYLEGLYVLTQPQVIAGEGIAFPAVYLSQAAEDGRKLADAARARFEAYLRGKDIPLGNIGDHMEGVCGAWREQEGVETQIVGEYSRLFDLVVIARTNKVYTGDWNSICEAALFDSGRPVLIAGDRSAQSMSEHIVIAWNGSTETARAIALGMPFLRIADRVTVLTVEGGTVPGPTGDEVARHLSRHGIRATAMTGQPDGQPTGEAILHQAHALGADLLIKGA
ncbi:MAG: universal stress protein, partial [Gammaproteobacteria bacterium]|nr:universal stress protein [Gammaproteobacteria bacterium]